MAKSLQEQLLSAGLTNKKKLKQSEREKQKQAKQKREGEDVVDEAKARAEEARKAKLEKDRALNEEQNEKAKAKAIAAQIKQLIENNAIDLNDGEIDYNFTDGKKIKRIQVSDRTHKQLSRGVLAIAKLGSTYYVIPANVADKIRQRNEDYIASQVVSGDEEFSKEDDPYADYPIPDDLMW